MNEDEYEKLLSEVEEEYADMGRLIVWLKKKLQRPSTVEPVTVETLMQKRSGEPLRFPRLKPDTFFKMSFQHAIKECLSIMRRPMSARDITNALQEGGLTHKAKDLYQTVFPTLLRMKEKGEVDKLANGDWGLAEWYERKSSQPQAEEGK